jgi:D-3-phosphoglycerate dehydrogenase
MKTIAIADAFMPERYYRSCFGAFPDFRLEAVPFFGLPERHGMRDTARRIEVEGPEAVELPEEIYASVEEAEAIMSHLCPVNALMIERAKGLKIILSNRGGLENIDLEAATRRGIPVLHNPAHNANSVAELTLGLMLAETRNIARTHGCLMRGEWRERFRNAGQVYEIAGRTVGIVGFGNIGRRVAKKLSAFDCRIIVSDPFVSADDPDLGRYGCEYAALPRLLAESDIITLHARSKSVVLRRDDFLAMKRGAYFINTARPHLIDGAAAYECLRDGRLMGAAFDVFPTEPIPEDDPLLSLENVTLTNHRGGDTENCYSDSPAMLLREARAYFAGGEPKFFANKARLSAAASE